MKTNSLFLVFCSLFLVSCDYVDQVSERAREVQGYEKASLRLAKENRGLKAEINRLRYEIENLKSKNNFLQLKVQKMDGSTKSREVSSVAPVAPENDLVRFSTYKWTPSQVLAIAENEFDKKNYEKAAQFFHSFAVNYPGHQDANDQFFYQAGVAAYESGDHDDWSLMHFEKLVENYPTSPYYRGAKLWMALTHLKQGEKEKFFNTVEEFRKKYRNTKEWKILSSHYEQIVQKYKN